MVHRRIDGGSRFSTRYGRLKIGLLVAAWLALGGAALFWHFGPGQAEWQLSTALQQAKGAEVAARSGDWQTSARRYALAIAAVPEQNRQQRQRLTVAHAVARIQAGEMVEGQAELQSLVSDLEREPVGEPLDESGDEPATGDRELLTSARDELATASYQAAWLMRLEGATADEWMVETTRARQQFRLLAEEASGNGDENAALFQKNLEATINLENMDLATLLARPLPKKCPKSCRNLSKRKRQECESQCNSDQQTKNGKKQQPQDARKQVKQDRGAGLSQGGEGGS